MAAIVVTFALAGCAGDEDPTAADSTGSAVTAGGRWVSPFAVGDYEGPGGTIHLENHWASGAGEASATLGVQIAKVKLSHIHGESYGTDSSGVVVGKGYSETLTIEQTSLLDFHDGVATMGGNFEQMALTLKPLPGGAIRVFGATVVGASLGGEGSPMSSGITTNVDFVVKRR
jgi:hypothetical protein